MSDYEINVIFSICLSVTLLALGAEFYRLINAVFKELKNNRDRAVEWPQTLSTRCIYLIQVEFCFLISLMEGVNLLYSLNDVAYGKVEYIEDTAAPGLSLPCFLIVAVFFFSMCQVGCIRASRPLSRFRSERELKPALDFCVWLNLSDLLQLWLLYFGIEKFSRIPSARHLTTCILLMSHAYAELSYDFKFAAKQLQSLAKDLQIIFALTIASNVCLCFLHTIRFGVQLAKFFTIDDFSQIVSTTCQSQNAYRCLFWFDKLLVVFTVFDLLFILILVYQMKKMELSPKLLNPVVYFGPSVPLGEITLREDQNEYPAKMSLELEEDQPMYSDSLRRAEKFFNLAYECCQSNNPKVIRDILESNGDDLDIEALMKCASQWVSADVIDVLYPKMPRSTDREDHLPPVAYLGLNNQNASSMSFKRVLLRFRSYFSEPLDEDGNNLLHLFAVTNRIKAAAMLLELDPSVIHGINYMGLSSLDLVPNENIDMRILLLNSGGLHTIHGIARLGNIAAAEDIIHADKSAVYSLNSFGESACHVAAIFGQTKMIQLLIHRGANINHRNDDGWTPLDEAYACGNHDTAKLLLSHGASDRKIRRSTGSKSQFTRSGTL